MKGMLTYATLGVAAVATLAGILIALPWETDVTFGMDRDTTYDEDPYEFNSDIASRHTRESFFFPCNGMRCHAWLYLPRCTPPDALGTAADGITEDQNAPLLTCGSMAPPPVVIMAHGMGGTKDHKLDHIGAEIADAGYAALLFDYRFWGGSDGLPRHVLSPKSQLEDYEAAVQHVKATGGLGGKCDPDRVVLWGTSYSGGHSLVTAAKMGSNISAVIAMEPFLSSAAVRERQKQRKTPVTRLLRLIAAVLSDSLRSFVSLPGVYVTMVAEESEAGLSLGRLSALDWQLYRDTQPVKRLGGTKNLILCRIVWEYLNYAPLDSVDKVTVPTLLIAGLQDDLTPAAGIQAASERMTDATYVPLNGTHISLYGNPGLVPAMVGFLRDRVPLRIGAVA